ncbi:MAG: leucyl aminopeptidase [Desulfobulbaceae bacterium]|jgi:leucyl aminopeptidase|nr:leucyl aminopeptidase [Desulfobulbaceae bacterium]
MISLTKKDPEKTAVDLLVYIVARTDDKKLICARDSIRKRILPVWRAGDFSGKAEEVLLLYPGSAPGAKAGDIKAKRLLVVGFGKVEEQPDPRREQLRVAAGTAAAQARKIKAGQVLVVLPDFTGLAGNEVAECVAEGLVLGNYLFTKYKKPADDEDVPRQVEKFLLSGGTFPPSLVERGLREGSTAAMAACVARDMAYEPANYWTPAHFADFGSKLAARTGLKCTVLDKADMKRLGMGGILAVNQGSALPPKLVILEYRTRAKNPTLMLVGKGLTFDSGGLSLKPAAGMEDMKYDMCGGAAVLAAMQAVAEEKPQGLNVVALVPATDNMAGSAALKPGDVIIHYNGRTCEVVNTDAEGRLIVADALAYGIKRFKPDAVIDVATLTGAVIVGLGHHRTGLLSNNDALAERIIATGGRCGEPLWRLPLGPEYTKQLKSDVADLKNIGGKSAGTITAASFLQEFVGDTPWAHLDIAGTAWGFTEKPYIPAKGPSGIVTRTLIALIRTWQPLQK